MKIPKRYNTQEDGRVVYIVIIYGVWTSMIAVHVPNTRVKHGQGQKNIFILYTKMYFY